MNYDLERQGLILSYLRTSNGLSRKEMAKILELTDKTYGRYESSQTPLNAQTLLALNTIYDIPIAVFGGEPLVCNEDKDLSIFLPNHYRYNRYSSGLLASMYIDTFTQNYGYDEFKNFCKNEGVDPTYFINISNPINMRFINRLVVHAKLLNNIITKQFVKDIGNVVKIERLRPTIIEIADFINEEFPKYEKNHKYNLIDIKNDYIDIGIIPGEHLPLDIYNGSSPIGNLYEVLLAPVASEVTRTKSEILEIIKGGQNCKVRLKLH